MLKLLSIAKHTENKGKSNEIMIAKQDKKFAKIEKKRLGM